MQKDIVIFPEPQELKIRKGEVAIALDMPVVISKSASELEKESAELLIKYIEDVSKKKLLLIKTDKIENKKRMILLRSLNNKKSSHKKGFSDEDGYFLKIGDEQVIIEGKNPAGVLYAVQTLIQLINFKNGILTVPEVEIKDFPDYKYRGLFIENKWGPDLMTLQDWKNLIDYMANIKLNALGMGVYGCWCVQYENKITEFLLLPFKKYPDLKTPWRIHYYSPLRKREVISDYLPEMFTRDFFDEVIAYGRKRNVIVFPYFNSAGHNTLIPRLYPDVSAKESTGVPTNYGFYLTNPKTYELLFNIYDEIIDRYLKPQGIDFFHLQLDEVYEVNGVDFKDLYRKVDPWCKCSQCSAKTKEELFIDFFIQLARHLKEKGMKKIILYADYISKIGLINESFSSRLKKENLFKEVVIDCWWYAPEISSKFPHFPSGVNNKLGLNLWVKPITCYWNWSWYGSYLNNIFNMLDKGYKEGAEGAQSYTVYDYGYHQNYYCLAEYSWNQRKKETLEQFREKYARFIFGAQWQKGKAALDELEKAVTTDEYACDHYARKLPYYFYTYVAGGHPYPRHYPQEVIESLSKEGKKYCEDIGQMIENITSAEKGFLSFKEKKTNFPRLIDCWLAECKRIKNINRELLIILEVENLRKVSSKSRQIIYKLKEALNMHNDMMAEIERVKSQYIVPGTLRNLMPMRDYLTCLLLRKNKKIAENLPGGLDKEAEV